MKSYSHIDQKKNIQDLLKKISLLKKIISTNVVGSFSEKKDIKKIGDLDLVIISKSIDKSLFIKCKKIIKRHDFKIKKKLKINDTFGPLKYDKEKYFTVHLMIYDISGHINHCIKSPFTSFDWERKKIYMGKSLSEIYSVNNLQLDDFFYSRRSINNHLNDLRNNKISVYSYVFKKKRYRFNYKKISLNHLNKINYSKHIFQHTLNNFYKFWYQKNIKINKKKETDFLNEIGLNKNFSNKINYLFKIKNLKIELILKEFLNEFFDKIKEIKNQSSEVIFIRHAKTKLNNKKIFLGKANIDIINKKRKIGKIFDLIFSSPLNRSVQTANMFKSKKIIKNNLLKEINYGKAEGLKIDDFIQLYPKIIQKWKKNKDPRFPGGENNSMVLSRVKKFNKHLLSFQKKIKFKKCLVVTHNVFLRCLIGHYFNIKKNEWHMLKINHLNNFKFVIINGKLIPNISRVEIKKVFNYKINEFSSIN